MALARTARSAVCRRDALSRVGAAAAGQRWFSGASVFRRSAAVVHGLRPRHGVASTRWIQTGSGACCDGGGGGAGSGLADAGGAPFMVTTPIFYVNGAPHIGHLFTTVLADARARWARMRGHRVIFATGTDEHGLKVQHAAAAQGQSPQEFCDTASAQFRQLFDDAGVEYDDFVRTTEPRHVAMATAVWEALHERGLITLGRHEGWYCEADEAFLTDTQVRAATAEEMQMLSGKASDAAAASDATATVMVSAESGRVVERVSEENYKFPLSQFQSQLQDWLTHDGAAPVSPPQRLREVLGIVQEGLRDLSVSRLQDKVQWGIPVPSDPSHTVYVWLDALVNYLTVTGATLPELQAACGAGAGPGAGAGATGDRGAHFWPSAVHVVGKDILKFHAVYWPSFLLGLGLPPPSRVVAHGHWIVDNVKMSKSLGNVVDPVDLLRRHGRDECRYYLLREGGMQHDAQFSHARVEERRKSDLAGTLGNLVSRATGAALLPDGLVQSPAPSSVTAADSEFLAAIDAAAVNVAAMYEDFNFSGALQSTIELLYDANRYFNVNEPWLLKRGAASEDLERLNAVLWHVLECVRVAGLLLHPVMPDACSRMFAYLGIATPDGMQGAAALARVGAGPTSLTVGGAPHINGPGKFVLFPPAGTR